MVAEDFGRPVERHTSITSIWLGVEYRLDRGKVQFTLEADRVARLCSCRGHLGSRRSVGVRAFQV